MNRLKRTFFRNRTAFVAVSFTLMSLGALVFNVGAQTNAQGETPRVVLARTNQIKATVEDIDQANREVTLRGPQGNLVRFAVDESVRNFPQVKKGDEVNIGYFESVAFAIAPPGERLQPTSRMQAVATRRPGERPGGKTVEVTGTTATVQDIDRENRVVTLRTNDGSLVRVVVDPRVGNLERIKTGDRISATRTEALAISVDDPNARTAPQTR